jgi:hypothetical protein
MRDTPSRPEAVDERLHVLTAEEDIGTYVQAVAPKTAKLRPKGIFGDSQKKSTGVLKALAVSSY